MAAVKIIMPALMIGKSFALKQQSSPEKKDAWKDFVFDFGKHLGKTMFQVYAIDYGYIEWMIDFGHFPVDSEAMIAAKAAQTHKDRVDPYAQSNFRGTSPQRRRFSDGVFED
jgi:hypothetical protein